MSPILSVSKHNSADEDKDKEDAEGNEEGEDAEGNEEGEDKEGTSEEAENKEGTSRVRSFKDNLEEASLGDGESISGMIWNACGFCR